MTKEQLTQFENLTDLKVKTTNLFFRVLLAIFTIICIGAVVSFIGWVFNIKNENVIAFVLMIFSFMSYFLAQYLIKQYSFYRHGIEESLLLGSMGLFVASISFLISNFHLSSLTETNIACILLSLYSSWLYLRFGFLYSLIISAGAVVLISFNLKLPPYGERAFAFLLMGLFLYKNIDIEKPDDWDFRKENNSIFQACLFVGIYFVCNLRLPDQNLYISYFGGNLLKPQDFYMGFPKLFYWITYILIWIVPVTGLWHGLKKRKRLFIDLGTVAAVLTLMTNKDYLGLKHYSWDPAILGIISITIVAVAIKLLSREKFLVRFGYTSENILKPDRYGIDLMSIGGALIYSSSMPQLTGESKPFTGGESGGAGASRKF